MSRFADRWERVEQRILTKRADDGLAAPEDGGTPFTHDEIVQAECLEAEAIYTEE